MKSKEEAVAWATRCPCRTGERLELRQVFELADFTNLPPDLVAAEEALGKEIAAKAKG